MIFCLGVLLSTALVPMTARGDSVALRYHCSGGAQLTADTNLTTLNQVLASRSTIAFGHLALERMAGLLCQSWQFGSNSASLIEPLLADSLQNESLGALSARDSNGVDFVLALHTDTQRSQLWWDTMGKLFGQRGEEFTSERFTGSRWNKGPSGSFWMVPARDWLLFGRGKGLESVQTEYLKEITRHGRPAASLAANWLEGDLDLNLLADSLPEWAKLLKPAQIHISVAPDADKLETDARVIYPATIPWNSEPWRLPKELVRNPLISFTVGQDVAAFLKFSPQFSNFDDNPLTNQFYAWAIGQMPLQSYMAWPVSDPTNAMNKLSTEMRPAFNPILKNLNGTQILWQPARERLVWSDLRVVAPAIEPAQDNKRDFLLLSLFPLTPAIQPGPDQLWSQLDGRTNLIYYDWELTGRRLQQLRLLTEMLWYRPEVGSDETLNGLLIKDKLLSGLGTGIGKTVTEITRPAPNELAIVRAGPLGFTGLELVLLSDWLTTAGLR
jgi:hypothetical protein